MPQESAFHSLILILLLFFPASTSAMEDGGSDQSYKSVAVQFVSEHKVAIAAGSTALLALGAYKFYMREPKEKQIIELEAKNTIIHLQCTPGYLNNFDTTRTLVNSASHSYSIEKLKKLDLKEFIENGRIFLVEQKKMPSVKITLTKIAQNQDDLNALETALYQTEDQVSIYSRYKENSRSSGIVDCIIEYPRTHAFKFSEIKSEILKQK